MNGKSRCVPLDPTVPLQEQRESSVTNPDGSTTTTTESTTCSGGKCTTTTTNTTTGGAGGGGGTSSSSTTESIGDFCKKNPQAGLCAKTSNGQGATTGEDKSDGECDSKSTVIGCAKFGTPPADQQIPKDTKTVGLGTSPVQGFGAVCPAPNTFTVSGQTFTISYQPLCDKASWIKPLVLLVAGFISLGIVYGALKGA